MSGTLEPTLSRDGGAVFAVNGDGSFVVRFTGHGWTVQRAGALSWYEVSLASDGLRCNCGDAVHRRNRACKHVKVLLWVLGALSRGEVDGGS